MAGTAEGGNDMKEDKAREDNVKEEKLKADDTDIAALETNREKTIVKTSIIGIVTNLFLVGFKAFVGLVSNSIAVILLSLIHI